MIFNNTSILAKQIRIHALKMTSNAKASHIGSCLSMAELLAVLYQDILRVKCETPDWEDRDRFILSKGHGAAIYYAVLAEKGFIPKEWLSTYAENDSKLSAHVNSYNIPGIEVSSGSLGHGLPIACGMALAAKASKKNYKIYVLLSDGELDEGSNWESILFAAHHKLSNLTAIVDYNKIQGFGDVKDILNLEPLEDKFKAFGWSAVRIDGHNIQEIHNSLSELPMENDRPTVIIADTIKGKSVSFMEDSLKWHYRSPSSDELKKAISEIEKTQ
ncbi:MAG: transketolase [Candidatus Marinimicrobia bacterium]|jgi:transketolase|nr:transketolase [Candidatus Neomarinimicrobiota bacterium]MBT3633483.1 transketolase [Candidatus Neomarinimicrobiota bacterium]MBT3681625.1 transketolase [Candidatus Neomarinimicrobiota bacterium]MBT3758407.1 transketolase [Candidatus Neomarinimicrobiota bacterium]MBT3894939.1 transketolase [Candidatus Neomarinimicrobiota bacterium]